MHKFVEGGCDKGLYDGRETAIDDGRKCFSWPTDAGEFGSEQ